MHAKGTASIDTNLGLIKRAAQVQLCHRDALHDGDVKAGALWSRDVADAWLQRGVESGGDDAEVEATVVDLWREGCVIEEVFANECEEIRLTVDVCGRY